MKLSSVDEKIMEGGIPERKWDPTKVHSIQECARLFYFSHIRNIAPEKEPDYFTSGHAWDAAMGALEAIDVPQDEAIINAYKEINRVYDETSCDSFHPARTRASVLQLLDLYLDEGHFPPPYKVFASNLPVAVPYSNFFLAGELDKYMEWDPYGLVIGETKTSLLHSGSKSWLGYTQQFELGSYGHQVTHYATIVEMMTGKKVSSCCIFTACLDIPKRVTTVRNQFSRIWVEHSQQKRENWLDAVSLADAKFSYCWTNWSWPVEGQKCTGAWGTKPCAFRHICISHIPLHSLEQIPAIYKNAGEWAPWDGKKRN